MLLIQNTSNYFRKCGLCDSIPKKLSFPDPPIEASTYLYVTPFNLFEIVFFSMITIIIISDILDSFTSQSRPTAQQQSSAGGLL